MRAGFIALPSACDLIYLDRNRCRLPLTVAARPRNYFAQRFIRPPSNPARDDWLQPHHDSTQSFSRIATRTAWSGWSPLGGINSRVPHQFATC